MRRVRAVGVSGLAVAGLLLAGTATSGTAAPAERKVGTLTLTRCDDIYAGAWCGRLARRWDPTGAVPGRVRIGFAFVPASGARTTRTVVAAEGGPGYSSTGSIYGYAELFAPLLRGRNLLVVDQRGTGLSAPINCPELQELEGEYAPAAARCARRLGPRAHLYGTELAADDTAAVTRALRLGPVDLYGDSYGTFFSQTFAGRHPKLLRTLTLDAAYPTYGEDAWFDTQGPALRRSMATVCEQSAWCAKVGGSALRRFDRLLERVRAKPLRGLAPGADGALHRVVIDAPELAYLAYNATYVPTTYRELDAAVRAALRGDTLPLLRLDAEANYPGGGTSAPSEYSEGLDAAVTCRDYPQLYDLTAPPSARRAQLRAAIAAKQASDPDVYAPFTIREYLDSGWGFADWCLRWPVPPADYPPGPPRPPSGPYSDVPTLVLSGELDTITTPAEGRLVASQFPRSWFVQVPAALHVTAVGDTDECASVIVRDFVRAGRLGNTSCTERLPPLRTAPPFWPQVADAKPARPDPGSAAGRLRLRAASVGAATAADAVYRWWQSYEVGGPGLRGGTWQASGDPVIRVRLRNYRLVSDVAVSGRLVWNRDTGTVRASLRLRGAPAATGTLRARWSTLAPGAIADLDGRLGGRAVHAGVLAP